MNCNPCKYQIESYSIEGWYPAIIQQEYYGFAVKIARESRGMTVLELAKATKMHFANIHAIERGNCLIPLVFISVCSEILNYPMSFFRQDFSTVAAHDLHNQIRNKSV